MAYEKRVCVLKQIRKGFSADGGGLSGAVYAERLGTELTLTPRIIGLAPVHEGRYALALLVEGTLHCLELRGNQSLRVSSSPSIGGGFSVLLVYVRGEAEPIAFGHCGNAPAAYEPLLTLFCEQTRAQKRRRKLPVPMPPNELPAPAPNVPVAPGVPLPGKDGEEQFREGAYDDEAIAAQDYYRDASAPHDADENAPPSPALQEKAAENGDDARKNADAPPSRNEGPAPLTYYGEVRERFDEAFAAYPADARLTRTFPHSRWVNQSGVLLGIVYDGGLPRYLCAAVEAQGDPPAAMKERCVFVPSSPFSDDEGFWVVFQDASTGEFVTVEPR